MPRWQQEVDWALVGDSQRCPKHPMDQLAAALRICQAARNHFAEAWVLLLRLDGRAASAQAALLAVAPILLLVQVALWVLWVAVRQLEQSLSGASFE